ncbi:MAG: hypothetical protein O2987_01640 [Firmicutes bacterium]|nr:hypothetical protein [Bacillota bacterium]
MDTHIINRPIRNIQNRMIPLDQTTLTLAPYEMLFIPGKTA